MRQKIISAADAAKLIPDDAVVAIGSSAGLNCPDFVLKAVGERYAAERHPSRLTIFSPIAAGD